MQPINTACHMYTSNLRSWSSEIADISINVCAGSFRAWIKLGDERDQAEFQPVQTSHSIMRVVLQYVSYSPLCVLSYPVGCFLCVSCMSLPNSSVFISFTVYFTLTSHSTLISCCISCRSHNERVQSSTFYGILIQELITLHM